MKTSQSKSATLRYGTTAQSLTRFLDTVPPEATISVHHTPADRPGIDSAVDTITARWEEDL